MERAVPALGSPCTVTSLGSDLLLSFFPPHSLITQHQKEEYLMVKYSGPRIPTSAYPFPIVVALGKLLNGLCSVVHLCSGHNTVACRCPWALGDIVQTKYLEPAWLLARVRCTLCNSVLIIPVSVRKPHLGDRRLVWRVPALVCWSYYHVLECSHTGRGPHHAQHIVGIL